MDQTVHCKDNRTPHLQGLHDGSNGLPMQDTDNREYKDGYQLGHEYSLNDMRNAGQKPAACLL